MVVWDYFAALQKIRNFSFDSLYPSESYTLGTGH